MIGFSLNLQAMQLDLLDLIKNNERDNRLTAKSNDLLNALNESEKKPYEPFKYIQLNDCIVLIAKRSEDVLFNVLTLDGDTPENCTSNWRIASEVKKDLIEILKIEE